MTRPIEHLSRTFFPTDSSRGFGRNNNPYCKKGRHANPDTPAFLERTQTRKRFPHFSVYYCDPSRHLQESPARNRKKSKKGSFGGSGQKSQKIPKKVRKSVFLDFFRVFFETCSRPPKGPFLRLFLRFRARRARRLL